MDSCHHHELSSCVLLGSSHNLLASHNVHKLGGEQLRSGMGMFGNIWKEVTQRELTMDYFEGIALEEEVLISVEI